MQVPSRTIICFLRGQSGHPGQMSSASTHTDGKVAPPPPYSSQVLLLLSETLTDTRRGTADTAAAIRADASLWGKMDLLFTAVGDIFLHHSAIHFGRFPLNYTCAIRSQSH